MAKIASVVKNIKKSFILLGGKKTNYIKRYKKYSFSGTRCDSLEGYEAVITRLYHTIEKGLSYVDYRAGFGKDNIQALLQTLNNYIKDGYSSDEEIYKTALSVLYEYYAKNKEHCFDDLPLLNSLKSLPGEKNEAGGIVSFHKPYNTKNMNFEEIMTTRHSVRHFSSDPVSIDVLKDSIRLAQFTPSACNRQGWKTRIIKDKRLIESVLFNQNGNKGFGQEIDKLLVVLSDLRCFNAERETYQPFIDGGMYAESIINSLYYYGVASIPLSASLTKEQEINVRKILGISDAEILIMFIGVGNYFEYNQSPRSERKHAIIEVM